MIRIHQTKSISQQKDNLSTLPSANEKNISSSSLKNPPFILSNDLDEPNLDQFLNIEVHVRHLTARVTPQPQKRREGNLPAGAAQIAPPPHLHDAHLFLAHNMHDLVFVRRLQRRERFAHVLLFAVVRKLGGDVKYRVRGGGIRIFGGGGGLG